jgi:hypothetical protein
MKGPFMAASGLRLREGQAKAGGQLTEREVESFGCRVSSRQCCQVFSTFGGND